MEQPPTPNALLPPTLSISPPLPKRNGNSEKKKLPTAQELVAHYESQGIETSEASMKVIEDLQNVLYRVVSSRGGGGGGGGQKDKFMAKNSRTLDTVNTRLAILEMKLDSKPGYVETLAIGVGAGAILKGVGSVVPHVLGAVGQIWNSVRSSTNRF